MRNTALDSSDHKNGFNSFLTKENKKYVIDVQINISTMN